MLMMDGCKQRAARTSKEQFHCFVQQTRLLEQRTQRRPRPQRSACNDDHWLVSRQFQLRLPMACVCHGTEAA